MRNREQLASKTVGRLGRVSGRCNAPDVVNTLVREEPVVVAPSELLLDQATRLERLVGEGKERKT